MATNTATRDDRIELRTTKEERRLLASAAAYERLDVTGFIMRKVLPAEREVVNRAERIVLSERDSARVLEAARQSAQTDEFEEAAGTMYAPNSRQTSSP
jgi:uncharacterized protein (DUF1778 family)